MNDNERSLIRKLIEAGVEYTPKGGLGPQPGTRPDDVQRIKEFHAKWYPTGELSGHDSHGQVKLTDEEEAVLREALGMGQLEPIVGPLSADHPDWVGRKP